MADQYEKPYGLGGRTSRFLCRCGNQETKPFCDGSHKGYFEHDAVAFDLTHLK